MKKYIHKIEKIISANSECRGMAGAALKDNLENSARDMNDSSSVLIVTGFCIKMCSIGETDGPLGAISLAHALAILGKKVVIVTDKYSGDLLKSGIEGMDNDVDIIAIEGDNAESVNLEIMEKYNPQHVIAIERPGRAKDGRCYSMSGEDITDCSPDADIIFELARRNGIRTSAIGDGGNEIGMGKIGDYVKANVRLGEKICAQTSTDNLIVAGISNWGGHALSAVLSVMNDRMLMYDAVTETEILRRIVLEGAVDGLTKEAEMTVDGLSFSENIKIFRELREIAENELIKKKLI